MNDIKNIAKQWKSISLKQFSSSYNDLKIVRQEDLDKLSNIKIGSETILVMAVRKTKKPSKLDLILERLDRIENILTRNKIDGILERNHLI